MEFRKILTFLFAVIILFIAGCSTVQPERDYTGMTKQQVFQELSKQGAVYIGYNVCRNKMFSNGGKRFDSWNELAKDELYPRMRQWRINMQDKRIFGKHYIRETVLTFQNASSCCSVITFHYIRETVLTFQNGKVAKQDIEEWTYPPSAEYCAKVEAFTSSQGNIRPLLETEPMPQTPSRIDIEQLKKESADGNELATIKLALCYAFGKQVPENFDEAERLLKNIAGKGNADAQYLLGSLYVQGPPQKRNYKVAVEWLTKAAEQGFAKAQCDLGALYLFGKGVPVDAKKALSLYQKAAEQGNDVAMVSLGMMYYRGMGVSQNSEEAIKWWKKARKKGNENAILILKKILENK